MEEHVTTWMAVVYVHLDTLDSTVILHVIIPILEIDVFKSVLVRMGLHVTV